MKKEKFYKIQQILEIQTKKRWFILAIFIFSLLTPPLVSKGYDPAKTNLIIEHILQNAIVNNFFIIYPIFKILPIVFIFLLIFLGNKVKQVINFYVGLNYLLFAILQSISITEKYGFGLLVSNFILIMFVSLCWFRFSS